ncbi:MAG: protein kinase [Myxococcales bacterium]
MRTEPLSSTENLVGSVLLGRYRIVRELAKGGMGVVYLARAEGAVGFVKPVVVKLVLPEHASDERYLGMFVREAQILSGLRHPSIVDVIEFGEEAGGYVMVLEYVRGYHLGQWSKYLRKKGREIPTEILLLLMIDVLEALHKAHSMVHPDGTPMHIVHRDVSPSNILLDDDGRARLLDFGVARMRGGGVDYQTQVRSFVGKITYSAPEMFAGVEATPQSDIYSCGVVLHEMIFGRNVFSGKNQAATLNLVLNHTPEAVEDLRPGIPAGLDAILRKAMAKNPEDRFESARDFALALRGLQREYESELRAHFAGLLKNDFGEEMARLLGIESLSARDDAWRRLSLPPAPTDNDQRTMAVDFEEALGQEVPSAASVPGLGRPRQLTGRNSAVALTPSPSTEHTVRRPTGRTGSHPIPTGRTGAHQAVNMGRSGGYAVPPVMPEPPPMNRVSTETNLQAAPAPASGSSKWLFLALGVVGSLAVVAIALSLTRSQTPAPSMPPIRVVAESTPAQAPVVQAQPQEETTTGRTEAPTQPEETTRKPRKPAAATEPDPAGLTKAFRKQQGKIEECFKTHTAGVQGMPRMQLGFDLDASGKILRVNAEPAGIASTPLGKCLQDVGKATRFPGQGQPVSFAIPITASRGAGG